MKVPPNGDMFHPRRGISIKGQFYTRWHRGKLVIAAWPRKRQSPRSAQELDQRKLFALASRVTLYMDAYQQLFARGVADATTLLPRDLLMMALYTRGFRLTLKDGSKRYGMPALQAVSDLLDALGQTRGDTLMRGVSRWEALGLGLPGQIAVVNADGTQLVYQDQGGGGGGGEPYMQVPAMMPNVASQTFGAGAFAAMPILPSLSIQIHGVRFIMLVEGTGNHCQAGIYSANNSDNGLTGGHLIQAGPVHALAHGLQSIEFNAPVSLNPNQWYWVGLSIYGSGSVQFAAKMQSASGMFWTQAASPLPATAPTAQFGAGTSFGWWVY